MRGDSDKHKSEFTDQIPEGPTSIEDEYENGGWNKRSPQASQGGYNGGQAGGPGSTSRPTADG